MGKISDFLRKIGVMQKSKGDYYTGDIDNREDLKRGKEEQEKTEE